MFSKFSLGTLTALLLPLGMAMAQGHSGGRGAAAHTSGHVGSSHWSGHPGGSFGAPHAYNAYHGGSAWHSDFNRNADFHRHDFDRGDFARRDFDRRDFDRRDFDDRHFNRFGRGFYPYAFFGYPYWGYGYGGYYNSWYPYSSWYPYGSDYAYSYPDYGYLDYGVVPNDYSVNPPADEGYSAAPSYSDITTSRITITAPPGTEIWVEGVKIASGDGTVHTFQTPPLNPDQQYRYRVRAVWTGADGRALDQTQEVIFSAGAGVAVRFPTGQVAPAPQP